MRKNIFYFDYFKKFRLALHYKKNEIDIGYSGLKLFMIFKNINFTLFIYNIRVKGLLNKRLNCHKKSFTFSFLLPLSNSTKVIKDKNKDKEKTSKDMSKQTKGQLSVDTRQVQEGSKSGIK